MRVTLEEKEKSRDRILAAAGRLFRENGVQGASVGDIMSAAGMTHGGFYRHFADKEDLLAAALTNAFETFARPLHEVREENVEEAIRTFRSIYLSEQHLATPGEGCPAAALGPDIARADSAVRKAFDDGIDLMAQGLERGLKQSASPRPDALRDLAMLVGAVVLARGAGPALAGEILDACARPQSDFSQSVQPSRALK